MKRKTTKPQVWDRACEQILERVSPLSKRLEALEPGVNFFILGLEAMGATTRFSCEGHPKGFYIAFNAPYELAVRIRKAGFFRVEVEGVETWSIRLSEIPVDEAIYSDADRTRCLRWAAESWISNFAEQLKHLE